MVLGSRRTTADGAQFIAGQIAQLRLRNEQGGVALWQDIARRFEKLSTPSRRKN